MLRSASVLRPPAPFIAASTLAEQPHSDPEPGKAEQDEQDLPARAFAPGLPWHAAATIRISASSVQSASEDIRGQPQIRTIIDMSQRGVPSGWSNFPTT